MAHIPINHPTRPFYRLVVGLVGAYLLASGIVGLTRTWGDPLFDRGDAFALGLRTNLAFALLSVAIGALLLVAAVLGGNLDHKFALYGAWLFIVLGSVMLMLLRTEGNVLNFSMANCVVVFMVGLVLLTAGLYNKVGPSEAADSEDAFRHGVPATAGRHAG